MTKKRRQTVPKSLNKVFANFFPTPMMRNAQNWFTCASIVLRNFLYTGSIEKLVIKNKTFVKDFFVSPTHALNSKDSRSYVQMKLPGI